MRGCHAGGLPARGRGKVVHIKNPPDSSAHITNPPDLSAKERLEECALALFATRGYEATSVREIVGAAGVTKPTLYYYFGSKENLYKSLISGNFEGFMRDLAEVRKFQGTLREKLRRVLELHFRWLAEKPLLALFFYRAYFGQPYGMAQEAFSDKEADERDIRFIVEMLEEGVEKGEVPRSGATVFSAIRFLAHVHIWIERNAAGHRDDLTPELAEKLVGAYLDGIA